MALVEPVEVLRPGASSRRSCPRPPCPRITRTTTTISITRNVKCAVQLDRAQHADEADQQQEAPAHEDEQPQQVQRVRASRTKPEASTWAWRSARGSSSSRSRACLCTVAAEISRSSRGQRFMKPTAAELGCNPAKVKCPRPRCSRGRCLGLVLPFRLVGVSLRAGRPSQPSATARDQRVGDAALVLAQVGDREAVLGARDPADRQAALRVLRRRAGPGHGRAMRRRKQDKTNTAIAQGGEEARGTPGPTPG